MSSRHSIKISDISSRIDSCRLKEFKKNQKESKKNGSILIGPFETKQAAANSLSIYRSVRNKNSGKNSKKTLIQDDLTYYFYFIHPYKNKRNDKLYTQGRPAAINSISKYEFKQLLIDIVNTGMYVIGPFETMPITEESKRINRTLDKKRN